jgi:WD40 repeat protein
MNQTPGGPEEVHHMVRSLSVLWLTSALLLCGRPPARAQPGAPRLDPHGEPLPPLALQRLGKVERLRQAGSINALAISPGGKLLASASSQGIVCLWELPSGKGLHTLSGHDGPVHCVAFSGDGKLLASAGADRRICVWDVATGSTYQRWFAPGGTVRALAFSADGKLLAGGGDFHVRALRIWSVARGIEVDQSFFDHAPVSAVALSPDGKTVVSAPAHGGLLFWDAGTGTLRRRLDTRQVARAVRFAPDGKTVIAGSAGRVSSWDAATGKLSDEFRPKWHWSDEDRMALSADGTRAANGNGRGLVVWDRVKRITRYEIEAVDEDVLTALILSADGKRLALGTRGGRIRSWDIGGAVPPAPGAWQAPLVAVAVCPATRAVATLERDLVRLWDPRAGRQKRLFPAEKEQFHCLAFAPSGRLLVAGGQARAEGGGRGQLRLWDADTGKPVWTTPLAGAAAVAHLAFAPDGKTLFALDRNRTVFVCAVATGRELRRVHVELTALDRLALSPDGRTLAGAARQGPAQIWDLVSGLKLGEVGTAADRFLALAFSPDGHTLAAAAGDEEVRLYEVATRSPRARLRGKGQVGPGQAALAFTRDGRVLAAGWADLSVSVWDTARDQEFARLRGHRDTVSGLAFAADATSLTSGSWDSTALVWDTRDLPGRSRPAGPLSAAALQTAWEALSGEAAKAHSQIWILVQDPAGAIALLKRHLRPYKAAGKTPEQLIVELESPRYPVRQQATADLARLGERARLPLMKALAKGPPLETRRRIEGLLRKLEGARLPPAEVRVLRALEVLEHIATPEARRLLEELARGERTARVTIEARAALDRLGRPLVDQP